MLIIPSVFSDHMVLQRNKKVAVWGESNQEKVTASLLDEGKVIACVQTSVKDGTWFLYLPPCKAGGPYKMVISDEEAELSFSDIMMGEVWLASGQSNMEFEIQNCKDGENIVKNATDEGVRFYYTPKVAWVGEELLKEEEKTSWELCSPESCGRWSAVGYFFAKKIAKELGVTVGVIGCNWGGTSASVWMPFDKLREKENTSIYVKEYEEATKEQTEEAYLEEYYRYKRDQAEFERKCSAYYATAENPTWEEALALCGENLYPGPVGPRNEHRPAGLYESMLKRVMPYSLAGFLYYQGEEDDTKPYIYGDLMEALISQWRADWSDETLPFLLVQLPMFTDAGVEDYKNWAFLREAQMHIFDTVKNTGIAVALDMGEYNNIHPIDKLPVGMRLAYQALSGVYYDRLSETQKEEVDGNAFGPLYRDYYVENEKLYLSFEHADNGIVVKQVDSADSIALGFEIAGEDGVYKPANVAFVDEQSEWQIRLSAEEVLEPAYARYCWTNYAEVYVFGANGIPMAPFRTSKKDGAIATGNSREGRTVE